MGKVKQKLILENKHEANQFFYTKLNKDYFPNGQDTTTVNIVWNFTGVCRRSILHLNVCIYRNIFIETMWV